MSATKRILLVGSYDRSLVNFRGELIRGMHEAGWEVIAAAPEENADVPQQVLALGAVFRPVPFSRQGAGIRVIATDFLALINLLRVVRPVVFLGYTIKPVGLGCIAATLLGVPHIYGMITGLGSALINTGARGKAQATVAKLLYHLALRCAHKVFVQNEEIATFVTRHDLIDDPAKIVVVPGSGVDVRHFACQPIPRGRPTFVFLGRFLRDKGVFELVESARHLKRINPDVQVLMIGAIDPANSSSVSAAEIAQWQREGAVTFLDPVSDVRQHLAKSWALVLPSYHEGLSRSALEAMALGRPIITTDTIGCRQTVSHAGRADSSRIRWGTNGALVPVRDSGSLAAAIDILARDYDLVVRMGQAGRLWAEKNFDVRSVNSKIINILSLVDGRDTAMLQQVI